MSMMSPPFRKYILVQIHSVKSFCYNITSIPLTPNCVLPLLVNDSEMALSLNGSIIIAATLQVK